MQEVFCAGMPGYSASLPKPLAFVACIAVLNVCMKSLDARLCGESAVDFTFILRV